MTRGRYRCQRAQVQRLRANKDHNQQRRGQVRVGEQVLNLVCLQFLDGRTLQAVQGLNKPVRAALAAEKHILSVDKPRFIHGDGIHTLV